MSTSLFENEILQQPKVVKLLLSSEANRIAAISDQIRGKFQYVLIAARGTSDNAARYAQYLFGSHNRLQVALATPSLYTIYNTPPDLSGALVIGVSQSGKSPDIISVLEHGRKNGAPTLAITNHPDSPLASIADFVIPLHAGEERSVAATKTYTTSLTALTMLSSYLSGDQRYLDQIQFLPDAMDDAIRASQNALPNVQRFRYIDRCSILGRGFNYSTTFEIALKIKELTGVIADSYSTADFLHGPIATVSQDSPVLIVAPSGRVKDDMADLINKMNKSGAELIIISDVDSLLNKGVIKFHMSPGLPEWLTPLTYVIPGQLFALQLTVEKKLNVDKPEGLTKVTETY
jgi:glucosamine--fructose-6-phosphate aminotransferase (isomerizing)